MSENRTLLIVDDEKDIVQAYVEFLAPPSSAPAKVSSRSAPVPTPVNQAVSEPLKSYEIITAYSGEEALAKVKELQKNGGQVAGGFFDVKMDGGMDGIRTIQELWKVDPKINCTIVTAYQDRSVQDINQLFGPNFHDQWDYLNKPFTHGEILQKARQMVTSWNRRKSLEETLLKLRETQAQLIQSERLAAIGQVSRGVGHEFGNILQRIVGKADLSLGLEDLSVIRENLKVILAASDRAALIVRNLQSFSKSSQPRAKVDLANVIADTLSLINHELKKNSIVVEDKKTPGTVLTASAVEMQQVLMNLVINAMHAMPKGGRLELGCKSEGEKALLWVQDSGCGIPPEALSRIFDYAYTTKGEKGSGLGLSISKEIVSKHAGRIEVKSEVGKGTLFVIHLPRES